MIAAGAGSENYMADVAFSPKMYTDLHVPHVSSDKSWDTHLFMANPNDFEETVYIDVVASDGTLTASSSKRIGCPWKHRFQPLIYFAGKNSGWW
jgi:hypothetical protein